MSASWLIRGFGSTEAVIAESAGMNPILRLRQIEPQRGGVMPVQRKVFRIEQGAGAGARAEEARDMDAAQRHQEFMAEIRRCAA